MRARGLAIAFVFSAFVWLAIAKCALAELTIVPVPASAGNFAKKSDVAAASAAAAAAQAAIPPVCTSVPAMDTTNGSVGSAAGCTPPQDNSRPANVQIAQANATPGSVIVTASDGSFSGVWPRTWSSAPSYAHAEIYGTSTPYVCMVVTATVSAVSGKCSQLVSTSLPGTLLALSTTIVNPLSPAPAGLTVRVVGRQ